MLPPTTHAPARLNEGLPCLEIKLWGIPFLPTAHELMSTLAAYALKGGPLRKRSWDDEEIVYHFLQLDWDRTLHPLLRNHSVPHSIVKHFKADIFQALQKKVYLVEDNLDTLFSLNFALESAGYDVMISHCARTLMEGVIPPTDLFILDERLHDGDGLAVYKKLRSRSETKNIPVIMTSSLHNTHDQAVAAGVDEFLEKPFLIEALLNLVSKHTKTYTN